MNTNKQNPSDRVIDALIAGSVLRNQYFSKAAQQLGRLGGKAKSEAKTKAARKNAAKGGWPKGKKRGPKNTL